MLQKILGLPLYDPIDIASGSIQGHDLHHLKLKSGGSNSVWESCIMQRQESFRYMRWVGGHSGVDSFQSTVQLTTLYGNFH